MDLACERNRLAIQRERYCEGMKPARMGRHLSICCGECAGNEHATESGGTEARYRAKSPGATAKSYHPVPATATKTVFTRILKSSIRFQCSMYSVSKLM